MERDGETGDGETRRNIVMMEKHGEKVMMERHREKGDDRQTIRQSYVETRGLLNKTQILIS